MPEHDKQSSDKQSQGGMASHRSDQINRGSSQQGGGGGNQRQQAQQQDPARKPDPGGGDAQAHEDLRKRDSMSDHAARKPQLDVERE
jgi:hypothetical protein